MGNLRRKSHRSQKEQAQIATTEKNQLALCLTKPRIHMSETSLNSTHYLSHGCAPSALTHHQAFG
jgi:hypothetical protein